MHRFRQDIKRSKHLRLSNDPGTRLLDYCLLMILFYEKFTSKQFVATSIKFHCESKTSFVQGTIMNVKLPCVYQHQHDAIADTFIDRNKNCLHNQIVFTSFPQTIFMTDRK